MKKVLFTIILFMVTLATAFADEITFTTSAPNAVVVNQRFRLKYTINRRNVREPLVPAIENFNVLAGPYRSEQSSTQIINGEVTSTQAVTFTYTLLAEKEGAFTIPGATIKVDGKEYTSNPVKVKVLPEDKSANGAANARQQRQNNFYYVYRHVMASDC